MFGFFSRFGQRCGSQPQQIRLVSAKVAPWLVHVIGQKECSFCFGFVSCEKTCVFRPYLAQGKFFGLFALSVTTNISVFSVILGDESWPWAHLLSRRRMPKYQFRAFECVARLVPELETKFWWEKFLFLALGLLGGGIHTETLSDRGGRMLFASACLKQEIVSN